MQKTILYIGLSVVGIVLLGCFIYGMYWVGKTVSYKVFYADMVEQTVREMVKEDALK